VRAIVEPIRHVASRLPWWLNKYGIATPLAAPYFVYAKGLRAITRRFGASRALTPQTRFIARHELEAWLAVRKRVDASSVYVIARNGNSWKFGGRVVG
jgi:hypothetical protein